MYRTVISIVVFVAAALTVTLAAGMGGSHASSTDGQAAPVPAPGCRVGVYDSRAIAIAYAGSKYNDLTAKMKEYQQAKAAGDDAKVKELDAWGRKRQQQLNRQGFSRMPVTDLLEPVKDQLPALAEKRDVSVIAFECNYIDPGANVEKVDVTLDLVKLYEPSEKTMTWITEAMKKPPVELDEANNLENP